MYSDAEAVTVGREAKAAVCTSEFLWTGMQCCSPLTYPGFPHDRRDADRQERAARAAAYQEASWVDQASSEASPEASDEDGAAEAAAARGRAVLPGLRQAVPQRQRARQPPAVRVVPQ